MDSVKMAKDIANVLYEDVLAMRSGDEKARDFIGAEVMALNAMLNLVKTELGAGTKE